MSGRVAAGLGAALLISLLASTVAAQVETDWSGRRAETVEKGRFEVGVFGPLRYGVTDNVELATHPLAFFVVPNLTAKINWNEGRPWRIGTRHGLHYPTPLLNLVSREGAGGILPATTDVPHIIAITNEVLATTTVPLFRRWFTVRLGFTIAPNIGGETLPPIELPIVFPRTAAYSSMIVGHAGIALEGEIAGPFYYLLDGAMFVIPGFEGSFAFENTIELSWRPEGGRFMLAAGGRGIWGGYPYGEQYHVLPMLDAKFAF